MGKAQTSCYQTLAKSVLVRDIAELIVFRVPPNEPVKVIEEKFQFLSDLICIVSDQKKTYGYITIDCEMLHSSPELTALEIAEPITSDQVISETLPIIDIPPLLENWQSFFVLSGTQITHTIRFDDLDSLPMKACLFSLFLELESNLIRILKKQNSEELGSAFAKISSARLEDITSRYAAGRHYKKNKTLGYLVTNFDGKSFEERPLLAREYDYRNLLTWSTFADLKKLIEFFPDVYSQLHFTSKTNYRKFFKKIEGMRDDIAHSHALFEYPKDPKEFSEFVAELIELVDAVSEIDQDEIIGPDNLDDYI